MRVLRSLLILGGLLGGLSSARAQEAPAGATGGSLFALLVGGEASGNGATTSQFAWAPDTTAAVRISEALVTGGDGMSAGWVKLALGGQPRAITPGSYSPPAVFDLRNSSLTIYGGNVPATWTSPSFGSDVVFPPPTSVIPTKTDDAAALTEVNIDELPILGVKVQLPSEGEFGRATVTMANADGTVYASRSVTFTEDGWWSITLAGPKLDDPTNPPTETPPPTADTPEPGTFLMAAAGVFGLAGWRLRRRESSKR